jgi:secondary thiamine-phosphate synthase enzyme
VLELVSHTERSPVHHEELEVRTRRGREFVDLTPVVEAAVRRSRIADGLVNVQTLHTTAAVVVNENEPLLLEDLLATLERLVPRRRPYRHDDMAVRSVNLTPGERANGHAHCKSLFLRTSETLAVRGGRLRLGSWQRVFLLELDGARERTVAITVLGPW